MACFSGGFTKKSWTCVNIGDVGFLLRQLDYIGSFIGNAADTETRERNMRRVMLRL